MRPLRIKVKIKWDHCLQSLKIKQNVLSPCKQRTRSTVKIGSIIMNNKVTTMINTIKTSNMRINTTRVRHQSGRVAVSQLDSKEHQSLPSTGSSFEETLKPGIAPFDP